MTEPWMLGIPARAVRIVKHCNIQSKDELAEHLKSVRWCIRLFRSREFGKKSYVDLCVWAGVEPFDRIMKFNFKGNPHLTNSPDAITAVEKIVNGDNRTHFQILKELQRHRATIRAMEDLPL